MKTPKDKILVFAVTFNDSQQGGLAAARKTGDHHKLVARDVHINLFEVVLAGTTDGNEFTIG